MKLVQPIRDREKLEEMKMELLKTGYKNYLMFKGENKPISRV